MKFCRRVGHRLSTRVDMLKLSEDLAPIRKETMRNDLTDITLILDSSGSMESCRSDAEGGLNNFIEEQKGQPGDALFTLVKFSTGYDFEHKAVPIGQVSKVVLRPSGGTALLDAVGRGIIEAGQRLAAMPEEQRPGLVVFVILTDGEENSSRVFKKETVRKMIEEQTRVYSWQFVFLGANQDAFAEAGGIGIAPATCANYAVDRAAEGIKVTSAKVSKARSAVARGVMPDLKFTDDEREELT